MNPFERRLIVINRLAPKGEELFPPFGCYSSSTVTRPGRLPLR